MQTPLSLSRSQGGWRESPPRQVPPLILLLPLQGKRWHLLVLVGCWGAAGCRGGPLSAARASGWGQAGLGAARRGSAVGYFNERCQGLQRGEEAEGEAERSLSKLGLGWGGLACRYCVATATCSAPAGTLRRSRSGHRGFSPCSPLLLFLLVPHILLLLFVLGGGWEGAGRASP